MIKDTITIHSINPTSVKLLSKDCISIHWAWWVLAIIFCLPALLILLIITLTNHKFLVEMVDSGGKVVYSGYVNKGVYGYICSLKLLENKQ